MNTKHLIIKSAPRQYFVDKDFDDLAQTDLNQFKDHNNDIDYQEEKDY